MGVTIHIRGRLKDPAAASDLIDEVADFARTLRWKFRTLMDPPMKGICLTPHENCESLLLLFDSKGILRNALDDDFTFVKTQGAPPDIHVAICKLLKHLHKKYFRALKVTDEGEYWETGDRRRLEELLGRTAIAIEGLSGALRKQRKPHPEEGDDEITARVQSAAEEATRDAGSLALGRLNGPQPPLDAEEAESWDSDRWIEFWRRWDEHRSPLLAAMRGKPETMESLRAAFAVEREVRKREAAQLRAVKRRMKKLRKRRLRRVIDLPEPEPDPPWSASVPTYNPSRDEDLFDDLPPSCPQAYEWHLDFFDRTEQRPDHPVVRYLTSALLPVGIGLQMSALWAKEDDMYDAVPTRMVVFAERLEQAARFLEREPELGLADLARSAVAIGARLRKEAKL